VKIGFLIYLLDKEPQAKAKHVSRRRFSGARQPVGIFPLDLSVPLAPAPLTPPDFGDRSVNFSRCSGIKRKEKNRTAPVGPLKYRFGEGDHCEACTDYGFRRRRCRRRTKTIVSGLNRTKDGKMRKFVTYRPFEDRVWWPRRRQMRDGGGGGGREVARAEV
jgi:hypothetical protein